MKRSVLRRLLCLSLIGFLSGCGTSSRDKLVGRWHGTLQFEEAAVERKLGQANNPIAKAVLEKIINAAEAGTMDFELKPDGEFTLTMKLGPLSKDTYGRWEVVEEDGDGTTIRLTHPDGDVQQQTIKFLNPDSFVIDAPGKLKGLAVFKCTRVQ